MQSFLGGLLDGLGGSEAASGTGSASPANPLSGVLSLLGGLGSSTAAPMAGSSGSQTLNALANVTNASALVHAATTPSTTTLGISALTPGSSGHTANSAATVSAVLGTGVNAGVNVAGLNIPVSALPGQTSGVSTLLSSVANSLLGGVLPVVNYRGLASTGAGSFPVGGGSGSVNLGAGSNVFLQALSGSGANSLLGIVGTSH